MALDDDTIQAVEKEFRNLTKQIFIANRAQKSSIETILKGTTSRKEQQKIIEQYKKGLQEQIDLLDDTNEEHKERIALYKKEMRETSKLNVAFGVIGKAVDFVAKVFIGFGRAVINTTKMFMDAGQRVKDFETATQHITKELGFAGDATQAFFQGLDFNIENFRTLSKQGADFGQSLFGLRKAALQAEMPILDFVDLIATNSQTFAKFFGTTQAGTPAIAEMSRGMRQFTRDELSRFGLTMEDTSEYMTTYLELMRASGRAETMSTGQLIAGSQNYAKELIRLSKLTGQSTDELNAQMEQQKQNGVLNAALAKMAPEEADRLRKLVTALGGAESAAGGLAVDLIAAGTPITDLSQKLAGTNQSLLQTIERAVNDPTASIEDTINSARDASNKFLKDFPQTAAFFMPELVTVLGDASRLAGAQTGGAVAEEVKKVLGPESALTQEVFKTKDTFDKVKVAGEGIVTAFITDPNSLAKATEKLAALQNKLVEGSQTVKDFIQKPDGGGMKSIPEILTDLGKIFDNVKGKMIDAAKAAFTKIGENLKSVYTKIKNVIHNALARIYNSVIKLIPGDQTPMEIITDSSATNTTVNTVAPVPPGSTTVASFDPSEFTRTAEGTGFNQVQANEFSGTGTAVTTLEGDGRLAKGDNFDQLINEMKQNNAYLLETVTLLSGVKKNTKLIGTGGGDLMIG